MKKGDGGNVTSPREGPYQRMVALGVYSRQCLNQLEQETGLQAERLNTGSVVVMHDPAQKAGGQRHAEALTAMGFTAQWLDKAALLALEPGLAHSNAGVAGGIWVQDDGSGFDLHSKTGGNGLGNLRGSFGVRTVLIAALWARPCLSIHDRKFFKPDNVRAREAFARPFIRGPVGNSHGAISVRMSRSTF